MVGWHHRLNGPEFKQMLGDGEGQGSLACCSPWGPKESNTNEQLNNSNISCLLLGKISFQFCAIFFRLLLFFFYWFIEAPFYLLFELDMLQASHNLWLFIFIFFSMSFKDTSFTLNLISFISGFNYCCLV